MWIVVAPIEKFFALDLETRFASPIHTDICYIQIISNLQLSRNLIAKRNQTIIMLELELSLKE